ncbi:MAG: hypothetical protein IJX04_05320 [Oscillospiraceae bacterium]|nr:hypothetical protein [Oscillospiraceae bacterium]
MSYTPIQSPSDITHFLDCTNSLHDAYLIGVEYTHSGHTCGNPHYIDPDRSELRLRWLVTSIYDKTVELVFTAPYAWQLRDAGSDITDTAVSFDEKGRIIWADDSSTEPNLRESGSYVIAQSMKWRFL